MWCVTRDCCGLFCASFTLILMCFAEFVQLFFVIGPWKGTFSVYSIVYTAFFLLSLFSHVRCMTQNPGAVPRIPITEEMTVKACQRCQSQKPIDAHHCRTCQRCIIRLDHHCPWVNNCVGYLNQKHFVLFLFWTGVTCLWCFITLGVRFYKCANLKTEQLRADYCVPSPADTICCVLNFVEAILFGLFVTVMMFDQFSVIFDNTTYIHKLKGMKRNQRRNMYDSLVFTFGETMGFGWLLPKPTPQGAIDNFLSMCGIKDASAARNSSKRKPESSKPEREKQTKQE